MAARAVPSGLIKNLINFRSQILAFRTGYYKDRSSWILLPIPPIIQIAQNAYRSSKFNLMELICLCVTDVMKNRTKKHEKTNVFLEIIFCFVNTKQKIIFSIPQGPLRLQVFAEEFFNWRQNRLKSNKHSSTLDLKRITRIINNFQICRTKM